MALAVYPVAGADYLPGTAQPGRGDDTGPEGARLLGAVQECTGAKKWRRLVLVGTGTTGGYLDCPAQSGCPPHLGWRPLRPPIWGRRGRRVADPYSNKLLF